MTRAGLHNAERHARKDRAPSTAEEPDRVAAAREHLVRERERVGQRRGGGQRGGVARRPSLVLCHCGPPALRLARRATVAVALWRRRRTSSAPQAEHRVPLLARRALRVRRLGQRPRRAALLRARGV